jgi:phosphohistidine phosphatase
VRVRQTVEGLAQSGFAGEVEFLDAFYLAEPEGYLEGLRGLPDTIERAMILAHNPGLEGLLQKLTGRIESLAAGSLAYLSLPIPSWAELHEGVEGELVELFNPRELRAENEEEEDKEEKKEKKEKEKKKEGKKEEKKRKK